jgi:hypothetical protein
MTSPKRFTKIAVLSGFIILLTVFVAYRSGAFDQYIDGDNSSTVTLFDSTLSQEYVLIDSPPVVKVDSFYTDIMYGSKSAPVMYTSRDTPKKKNPPSTYMGGSKSAMVVIVKDSSQQVYRNSETGVEYILMSGSKSGAVIKVPVHRYPKNLKIPIIDDSVLRKKEMDSSKQLHPMRGSKSGYIIDPTMQKKDTQKKSN